jgi:hypothetical protein
MVSKSEVLTWPAKASVAQARRIGNYSVEFAKTITRKQIEAGQTALRFLDPKELVAFRQERVEEERQEELRKIIRDLRSRDQSKEDFKGLVSFSAPAILKLIGHWGESGDAVSKAGIEQARSILSDAGVHPEIISGVLDQLPMERAMSDYVPYPSPGTIPSQDRVVQPPLFELPN